MFFKLFYEDLKNFTKNKVVVSVFYRFGKLYKKKTKIITAKSFKNISKILQKNKENLFQKSLFNKIKLFLFSVVDIKF